MKNCLLGIATVSFSLIASAKDIVKIVAGSCMQQARPKPALVSMAGENPDLTLLMGDNIYADTTNPNRMRKEYLKLVADPAFLNLKGKAPILATWDDHDFSTDDSNATNPIRDASKKLFLEFLGEGPKDIRNSHDGIYASRSFGEGKKTVHVIMLDTRYNLNTRSGKNPPPAKVQTKVGQQILGEAQWKWLENELKTPAALKIVVSSVQVFSNFHKYERWSVLPAELIRLKTLLAQQKGTDKNIIFLSGDRHFGEIAKYALGTDSYFEMTSSNLNLKGRGDLPKESNPFVLAKLGGPQYSVLDLSWGIDVVSVTLNLKNAEGQTKGSQIVEFKY